MRKALIIGELALMIITRLTLCAEDLNTNLTLSYDQPLSPRYHSNELSLDTFSGIAFDQRVVAPNSGNSTREGVRLGGGTGLNYFFTRNIGVAAEGFSEYPRHTFMDVADGSMVFRLPLGQTGLAAYVFGGAGHQFDPTASTEFHTGGGLEYRFTRHIGAFIEPRIIFKQGNYGFGRCGLRCNF
jgi:hypothetical protein